MLLALQVVAVFLVAVAMSLALAHALEFPGKLRLDRETYCAVQTIYYPGFTFGGFSEILSIVAVLALLLTTSSEGAEFVAMLISLLALAAMHAAYWILTHPVNRFWLKDQNLKGFGAGFFAIGSRQRSAQEPEWTHLRDRWEYSHVIRAFLGAVALIALTVAVAL